VFTGIIETTGEFLDSKKEGSGLRMRIKSSIAGELKIDQSVSHNGVCLTIVAVNGDIYEVTAIDETLKRSNLGSLKPGDQINLERSMKADGRLDGHIVQGHVDTTAVINDVIDENGSWIFRFEFSPGKNYLTVEKGSICVNGVSLTVVDSGTNYFTVAIIPYTFEHTNFHSLKKGDVVNLEFDIVGKYVSRLLAERANLS